MVFRTEPSELAGTRISRLLAPANCSVFRDATYQLQQDDSHTVEVRFELQVEPEGDHDTSISGVLYQQMEGKGMLMIDREDAQPSHTMWVAKPVGSPRWDYPSPSIVLESGEVGDEPIVEEPSKESLADRSGLEPLTPFPFTQPISTEPILCRICECQIPQWYFEKHSETCVEVHRLEAEIVECNESIGELKNTIRDIMAAMDTPSSTSPPEYRGVPVFTHSSSPSMPSPLQLFRRDYMQRLSMKKAQRRLLESLDEILLVASEISMPSLKEEESKEPIERQRLLSPGSERKMSQIRTWCRPPVEDAALSQLAEDVERIMRQKVDNVVRMQNTIKYSEKIWHEWEEKVTESLAIVEASESSDSEDEGEYHDGIDPLILPIAEGVEAPVDDDHPTNQSEELLSSEPTPMASASPILIATPSASRASVSAPVPQFAPPMWQIINKMPTRSSTPSSISSPLALAAPITASPSPDDQPPYMDLNDTLPENATVRTRRSASNLLEPRLLVTPPMSPSISPRDAPTATRRGHRRYSTVNPILSPSVLNVPLSPRQSSAAPLSRSTPTSIKDFDIIKPISKGAFGSVFLAKKKATGDYYAIKVLKKADMIAKNQITNVKAERMILMKQAESPFVAKLYFTFQSKENLYLVMEYLNGGDCAALIKSLGSLPEEWTKQYIAEVILGLEYLHQRGVVHR
jgi:serine/threonine-protein kinase RIM15